MSLVETPFKLTLREILNSAAATLCLIQLKKIGTPEHPIADLCFTPQYGFTASASIEASGPRFVRITDIREGTINWSEVPFCDCPNSSGYELKTDDILIARAGASIGKSFLVMNVPETAVFASYMIRLRTKPKIAPSYIYWCCQSQQFWQQITEAQRGSAMKNINGKMLSSLRFPIPSREIQDAVAHFLSSFRTQVRRREPQQPLPSLPSILDKEQQLIARIEGLADRIEVARGLRSKALMENEKLLSNVLHGIFVDGVNRWSTEQISSVAEIIDPNPSHRMPHYAQEGIPFISTVDFDGPESIRRKTAKYVMMETYEEQLKRCSFAPGDILYSRIGTIGQARILNEVWPFALSHVLVAVKPKREVIIPRFLLWYLRSDSIISQAESVTRSIGVPDLGIKQIRVFQIPVPPIPEQEHIVAYLDDLRTEVDTIKQLQSETSAELDALLPSVLDKAFKGEL